MEPRRSYASGVLARSDRKNFLEVYWLVVLNLHESWPPRFYRRHALFVLRSFFWRRWTLLNLWPAAAYSFSSLSLYFLLSLLVCLIPLFKALILHVALLFNWDFIVEIGFQFDFEVVLQNLLRWQIHLQQLLESVVPPESLSWGPCEPTENPGVAPKQSSRTEFVCCHV